MTRAGGCMPAHQQTYLQFENKTLLFDFDFRDEKRMLSGPDSSRNDSLPSFWTPGVPETCCRRFLTQIRGAGLIILNIGILQF